MRYGACIALRNRFRGHLKSISLSQTFKKDRKSKQVAGIEVHPGRDRSYNITLVQRFPNKDAHSAERGREERGRRNKSSDVLSG